MELFDFQKEVLNRTEGKNRVAYFLDMGLGKTFVGTEKMLLLGSPRNLIICQKSKIEDWVNHVVSFTNFSVFDLTDKKQLTEFLNLQSGVGIINYELAWRRPDLLKLSDYTLMLDESSLIQNRKTKQSKFVLKLNPTNVILLSGTPTSGKYENLWTQANLLGWDIKERTYLSQYVNWEKINVGIGRLINIVHRKNPYKNVDRLKRKFREHGAIFLKTEDVIELPTQREIEIKVKPSKEYGIFLKDAIVTVKGRTLVGDMRLTFRLYLRQLAAQYSNDKLKAFEDLILSTEDRLIVFYNFNDELHEIEKICEKHSRPVSKVNGSEKNLDNYNRFENSITLVQYQAGSMGLNLQLANKVIYFSPTESSENFEQSKKRIHRVGQNRACFYFKLIVKNSIEEVIYRALARKKNFTDELFVEYLNDENTY